MKKAVICAWMCPECCEKYNLIEERELSVGHEQYCENCLKGYKQTAHELARMD